MLAVDTGFIVHNDRTYPHLRRLFAELGVETRPTEMSMSIHDERSGVEFAGGPTAPRVCSPSPAGRSIPASSRSWSRSSGSRSRANAFLHRTDDSDQTTYGEFLRTHRFSDAFVRLYAVPLVSCVWSMGTGAALDYPARYLFRFLDHHGLLELYGSPQWYTVVGGSRTYVEAIGDRLPHVRAGRARCRTCCVTTPGSRCRTPSERGSDYDGIVIATHADQALDMLADASREEKEILGAFRYSRSETVLHTDARLLPNAPRAHGPRGTTSRRRQPTAIMRPSSPTG